MRSTASMGKTEARMFAAAAVAFVPLGSGVVSAQDRDVDPIGFHVNTFETYAHLVAGNRGDYLSLRKREV